MSMEPGFGVEEDEPAPIGMGPGGEVRVPLWEDVNSFAGAGAAFRLRIQRRENDGTLAELGHLPPDATMEVLLSRWPKPGTYYVVPIDEHGRALRPQPYVKVIPRDHAFLLALAEGRVAPTTGLPTALPAGGGAGMSMAEMLKWMEGVEARAAARTQAEIDRINAMREELANERRELSDQKLRFAGEGTAAAIEVQAKLVDAHTKREDAANTSLVQMMEAARERDAARFENEIKSAEAKHRMEIERLKMQTDIETQRIKADIEIKRLALEQEEARRAAEAKERLRIEAEERKERREREEKERERDREHREALAKMITDRDRAADPIAQIGTVITGLMPVAKALGIDLRDVGAGLMGPKEPKGTLATIVESVATIAVEGFKARNAAMEAAMLDDDDEDDPLAGLPGNAPPQIAMQPQPPPQPMYPRQDLTAPPGQAPAQPQPQPGQPGQAPAAAFGGSDPSTTPNPYATLDPATVKVGRRAARQLVEALTQSAPTAWPTLSSQAAAGSAELAALITAAGWKFVLAEAGATEQILAAVTA